MRTIIQSLTYLLLQTIFIFLLLNTDLLSVSAEGSEPVYLNETEKEVLNELNLIRKNPSYYANLLEELKTNSTNKFVEGDKAINDAIKALRSSTPMTQFSPSLGMSKAARDHLEDLAFSGGKSHLGSDKSNPFNRMNRYGKWRSVAGENISYNSVTPKDIVLELIIDDGIPSRGRRLNVLNPNYSVCGIACGKHKVYKNLCVITLAGGYTEE
jgi:uncharacterized protein YkwD